MSIIETRDFGALELHPEAIYQFPQGLYGFSSSTEFALFAKSVDEVALLYLQSTKDPSLCFFVFEPLDFFPDFNPLLSKEDLSDMEVSTAEDLIFLSVATIPVEVKEMSLNIKSPIVLNPKSQKGMQVFLQNVNYPVRYHPFSDSGKDGASC